MEYLYDQFRNFKSSWKNGKVFMAMEADKDSDEDTAINGEADKGKEKENKEKKDAESESLRLDRVLKGSFLHLSVNDIEKVDKDIEKLDHNHEHKKDFEKKLRKLTEYYLSLAMAGEVDKLPSRILARIYQSDNLRKRLAPKMAEAVRMVAEKHIDKLAEIVNKDPEKWTPEESIRVCTLYQSLRKEGEKDETRKKLFERTKDRLKEKRNILLDKFRLDKDGGNLVKNVLNESGHPPTREEKIFILEIEQLFPSKEKEWPETEWKHWDAIRTHTMKTLLKDLFSEKSKEKVHPGNYLLWEALGEIDFTKPENKKILTDIGVKQVDVRKTVGALSSRWNGVQFLAFLKEQASLNPEHLRILEEILEDKDKIFSKENIREYPSLTPEDREKLVGIIKKVSALEAKRIDIEKQICDDVKENEEDAELTARQKKYKEYSEKEEEAEASVLELLKEENLNEFLTQVEKKRELKEKTQKKNKTSLATTKREITAIKKELISAKTRITTLDTEIADEVDQDKKEELKELRRTLPGTIKDLKRDERTLFTTKEAQESKIPQFETEITVFMGVETDIKDCINKTRKIQNKDKATIEVFADDLKWLFQKFEKIGISTTNDASFIEEWRKSYTAFSTAKGELETSRKALISDANRTSEEDSLIENLEKEEGELRIKAGELEKKSKNEIYNDINKDPESAGKEIEKNYYKGLKERVKDHTLRAADLDVLWERQEVEEKKIEEAIKEGSPIPPEKKYTGGEYKKYNELRPIPEKKYTGKEFKKYEEFRKAFDEKITEYLGKSLFDKDDSLNECIRKLEDKLSDVKLGKYFKEDLAKFKPEEDPKEQNFREAFVNPEILLEGAKRHFQDKIIKHVIGTIDSKTMQQEFIKYWNGIPRKIESKREMYEVVREKQEYNNGKAGNNRMVEKEQEKNDTLLAVETIEKTERKSLDGAFSYAVKNYRRGEVVKYKTGKKITDAEGNETDEDEMEDIYIPGEDDLVELTASTRESTRAIQETTKGFAGELQSLGGQFAKRAKSTEEEKEYLMPEEELGAKIKNWIDQWPTKRNSLQRGIDTQKEICMQHIGGRTPEEQKIFQDMFVEKYYKQVDTVLARLDRFYAEFNKEAGTDGNLTGETDYFTLITTELSSLNSLCDFRDGLLARETARNKKKFQAHTKVIERLKKEGFWEKDVEDFEEKLQTIKTEYSTKFSQYQTNVRAITRVIENDVRILDDKEFIGRYKIDKDAAQKIVKDHHSQNENFEDLWNGMTAKDSFYDKISDNNDFASDWVNHYKIAASKEDGQEMQKVLERLNNLEEVTSNIDIAEKASGGLADWLKDYNIQKANSKGLFGRFKVEEFSLYDIYRVFKESFEATNKHWKRNSDKHVATIGKKFWGEDNRWGREFARMQEESETARFKEFETQYHDQPGWVILKAMRRSKNPDMVRGCINLLSEKGFLRWDDPILWEVLNRLSRHTHFRIPEDNKLSPHEILEKVKTACEGIWTPEIFRQWETGHEGNLTKAKDQYKGEFAKYENNSGARTEILAGMLQRWSQGEVDDVDPARYESFLYSAFDLGKMNGQPDQRWYFVIMGVSTRNPKTGQALLSQDVLMRINKDFLQRFPFVDFFADKESPKLNGRIVPPGTPGAREGKEALWNDNDYQNWARMLGTGDGSFDPTSPPASGRTEAFFYQVINESLTCKQRVQRMGRFAQSPDHDDGVNYQFVWDQNRVMENLNLESTGRGQFSEDFWRSWLSGFDKFVRNKKATIAYGDANWAGQDFWIEDKKRHLLEIGKSLRVALTVTQTLQGNKSTQRGPTTFDKDEWSKSSQYAINGEASRQNINDMARYVFQEKGEDRYNGILETSRRDDFGKDEKERQSKDLWKETNEKVVELLDSSTGDEFFKDDTLMERALDAYCASSPERAPAECIL